MSECGVLAVRVSVGIVFVPFGLLEVLRASPVYELVANSVHAGPPEPFVPFVGNDIVDSPVHLPLGASPWQLISRWRQAEAVKELVFVEALAVSASGRGYLRTDVL